MIKTIASVGLPADEKLEIKKNRICPEHVDEASAKRISIVTGIHGDELEGQFICFELNRILKEHMDELQGIVDIYPAMNPFGIDCVVRGFPGFDLDMNRTFPGNEDGDMMEFVASEITKDLLGSDLCIDIHASNMYLTEMPQVRINELNRNKLVPIAANLNIDFIWVHGASTVLESTLAYSLNSRGTDTLVLEMGVGMRVTKDYCDQVVTGIFNVMKEMGIWTGDVKPVRDPIFSEEADKFVDFLNAECSGIFVKEISQGNLVKAGDLIGRIIDPLQGIVLSEVHAPRDGLLFTIREYPVVGNGTLVGRILHNPRHLDGSQWGGTW